ncbi:MAG: SCO family protein [Candidatus Binatus sp.]|uniref:SCO family protein n=1 Tax=Candidatus Binatus sp. TaxID=2811406 RepID=UPI00272450C6|nr:SCO family protein [Candidatus Binatus sp.]MDO8433299.1 SCO family protein [Candidatus Binatus sp.]
MRRGKLRHAVGIAAIAIAAAITIAPRAAEAHRNGGPNDPCERRIGTSLIHLTLYQPQFDPDAEYCDSIPRQGITVMVVDVSPGELRGVPFSVEVLDAGDGEGARPILSLPAKVYRRGVVDAQVMLDGGRRYIARVALSDGASIKGQELSFPIRVAAWYRALIVPALALLALIGLIAASVIRYYIVHRRQGTGEVIPIRLANRSMSALVFAAIVCGTLAASGCSRDRRAERPALPDVQLIDNHDQPLSLGSLKGKVVLLDFVHIGCPGVCTNLTNKFGQVADSLGPELGSRVVLLTISNDPKHDTPEALLKFAKESDANVNGWIFMTGDLDSVNRVIHAFGLNNENLPDGSPNHITQVFLLDADGRQKQAYQGMTMDSKKVAAQIKQTLEQGGA